MSLEEIVFGGLVRKAVAGMREQTAERLTELRSIAEAATVGMCEA